MQNQPQISKTALFIKRLSIAFLIENIFVLILLFIFSRDGFSRSRLASGLIFAFLACAALVFYILTSRSKPSSGLLQKAQACLKNPTILSLITQILFLSGMAGLYLLFAYGLKSSELQRLVQDLGIHVPNILTKAIINIRKILTPWLFGMIFVFITSILFQFFLYFFREKQDRKSISWFYRIFQAILFCLVFPVLGIVISIRAGFITVKSILIVFYDGLITLYHFTHAQTFALYIGGLFVGSFILVGALGWLRKKPIHTVITSYLYLISFYFALPLLVPFVILSGLLWAAFNIPAICILWGICYAFVIFWLKEYVWIRRLAALVAVAGMLILVMNSVGFFLPYPGLDAADQNTKVNLNDFTPLPGEKTLDYSRRMTDLINKSIHRKDIVTVPFYKNFFLHYYGNGNYEFCDYRRAVQRGQGLCSQQSLALAVLLSRRGIPTQVNGLDGHVVTSAQVVDDQWWILDSNYDVIIPHTISEIEKDPEIIRPYYKETGYSQENIDTLVGIYGSEGNSNTAIFTPGVNPCVDEDVTYLFIWLVPIMMIIPFIFWGRKRSVNAHPA